MAACCAHDFSESGRRCPWRCGASPGTLEEISARVFTKPSAAAPGEHAQLSKEQNGPIAFIAMRFFRGQRGDCQSKWETGASRTMVCGFVMVGLSYRNAWGKTRRSCSPSGGEKVRSGLGESGDGSNVTLDR